MPVSNRDKGVLAMVQGGKETVSCRNGGNDPGDGEDPVNQLTAASQS